MTTFDDPAFVAAFRDTTLPTSAFHHRDHVRMAWLYVREHGPMDAAPRFATDLQAFARATGVPGLYHATITGAYIALIVERQHDTPAETWDAFAAARAVPAARPSRRVPRLTPSMSAASRIVREKSGPASNGV
jgi:hypothetical protein